MTNHTDQPGWRARKTSATLAAIVFLGAALPTFAHRVEKRYAVEERPVVTVKNSHGRITVKSWPRTEVLVVGDHSSSQVEIDTEKTGNRIEVVTHVLEQNLSPNERRADYEITVPEETELQIRNDAGEVVDDLDVLPRRVKNLHHPRIGHQLEEWRQIEPRHDRVDDRGFVRTGELNDAQFRPIGRLPHEFGVDGYDLMFGQTGAGCFQLARRCYEFHRLPV